jgi:hypothetical protein
MGSGWSEEGIILFNRLFSAVEDDRKERGKLFLQSFLKLYLNDQPAAIGKNRLKPNVPKTKAKTNLKRKWVGSDDILESVKSGEFEENSQFDRYQV